MVQRATTANVGKHQGKDSITKTVRAMSKHGAILGARVDAITTIPIRDQEVVEVNNLSNERFFDQWEVQIVDANRASSLGRSGLGR